MIEELQPYAEMRLTGLEWLPTIPAHWPQRRVKTVLQEVDQRTFTGQEKLLSLRMVAGLIGHHDAGGRIIPAEALVGYKKIEPGQIVMNRMRAASGLFGIAKEAGLVSPDYAVFVKRTDSNLDYLLQLFKLPAMAAIFRSESKGLGTGESGFLRLYTDRFGPIPIPFPPIEEQQLIVRFLDWHSRVTGKLIRAKLRLIAMLNEQKQSIIHGAVTRGLDPAVQFKSSGVDWIGDIPEHWEISRLKNVAEVVLGKMLTPSSKGGDKLKPYLRSANIQWETPNVRDVREMWIGESEADHLLVRGGDLLVSEGGEVGRACLWNDELPECYIQNSVHRVIAGSSILPRFLLLLFICDGKRGRFDAAVNRVSIAHLTREKLVGIHFAIPPLDEQLLICNSVDVITKPLVDAITRTRDEIVLIREFQTRLIADVVTGQLDVRAFAADLPEITEAYDVDDLIEEDDLDDDTVIAIDDEDAA